MTAIVDSLTAAIAVLKADAAVAALVGTRVYGDEMPRAQTGNQEAQAGAVKAVVITPSGGVPPTWAHGTTPIEVRRIDVYCYGETTSQAEAVRRAVYAAFRAVSRQVFAGVMVHWINPAGGAISGRDPETNWPVKWNSWQLAADERSAA